MKKKHKLSVVTINFNNCAGLKKTIESVVSQTNRSFEYVVIDGSSTDGSVDLLHEFSGSIDFWESKPDKNEYDGMNKGIRNATGEYVMFLNSGDTFYSPGAVEQILSFDFNEGFVYADVCVDYQSRKVIKRYPDILTSWFLFSEMICHQVQLIRKDLFRKFGDYDDSIKIVADYDFMIKVLLKGKVKYKHLPVVLAIYQWGGKSTQPEAAKSIHDGKHSIQDKYFDRKILEVLRQFDREVYQQYISILNSRSYKVMRILTRFSFLNRIGNAIMNLILFVKRFFAGKST